jgi:hypothetical protein
MTCGGSWYSESRNSKYCLIAHSDDSFARKYSPEALTMMRKLGTWLRVMLKIRGNVKRRMGDSRVQRRWWCRVQYPNSLKTSKKSRQLS